VRRSNGFADVRSRSLVRCQAAPLATLLVSFLTPPPDVMRPYCSRGAGNLLVSQRRNRTQKEADSRAANLSLRKWREILGGVGTTLSTVCL
jgi:hypothetical protein